jgi:hypothetical protein
MDLPILKHRCSTLLYSGFLSNMVRGLRLVAFLVPARCMDWRVVQGPRREIFGVRVLHLRRMKRGWKLSGQRVISTTPS